MPLIQYSSGSESSSSPITTSFPQPTQEGNILLCLVQAATVQDGSPPALPVISPPSTPGFTWKLAATESFQFLGTGFLGDPAPYVAEVAAIYYILNAPSMAISVETSVSFTGGGCGMQIVEFQSYPGASLGPTAIGSGYFTQAMTPTLVLSGPGLIVCFAEDPQFDTEFAAGTGYSVIPTVGIGTAIGGSQYQDIFGGGNYSTAFGPSIYGGWAMVAVSFLIPPPPIRIPAATNGFTPLYPPIKKQPFGLWGLEAKRADSITADGVKQSVLERIDSVTTLYFPFVALSDMPQWQAFESYALTGGVFTYLPLDDYPNEVIGSAIEDQMFQWPGTVAGETGCSICQLAETMDWKPKFSSPGIFSLTMKLRDVSDEVGS